MAVPRTASDLREIVAFRIGNQEFCLDIRSVREIRSWTPTTVLPHAPPYVRGVINLRGAVVPIINLAERLALGALQPDTRHVIIIAVIETQIAGLLVDAVSDILTVAPTAVQATPRVGSEVTQAFVRGVIAMEQRMLRLIDLSAVIPGVGDRDL